jgi:vacuolar iron transporter family protein
MALDVAMQVARTSAPLDTWARPTNRADLRRDMMMLVALRAIIEWIRPYILEAGDGILTSAGICEGLAGAGVGTDILVFAASAGLIAGGFAMGATEYSKAAAERDRLLAQLASERTQLETSPDAELDELTQLYVARGLSFDLARQVAIELTAHDALQAHAEAEYGIIPASLPAPPRVAAAAGASYVLGATIPLLAMALIPGPSRAIVTFIVVLLALALTGWVSARISDVHPAVPIARTAGIGALAMAITYVIGRVFLR